MSARLIVPVLLSLAVTACNSLLLHSAGFACQSIESETSWGGISGLAHDNHDPCILYGVHDHNLQGQAIYVLDICQASSRIKYSIPIRRSGQVPDYDLEGISQRPAGGFWLASEGKPGRHLPNLLVRTDAQGRVLEEVPLPPAISRYRVKAGLEGIASTGEGKNEQVVVVFQRRWKDDPKGQVKIGLYSPASHHWQFFRYPLDARKGTGLSAVSFLPDGSTAVLERDNKPFHKARIKRIYRLRLPRSSSGMPLLKKELLTDLLSRHPLLCGSNGKLEGMTAAGNRLYLVADDDGDGTAMLLRVAL